MKRHFLFPYKSFNGKRELFVIKRSSMKTRMMYEHSHEFVDETSYDFLICFVEPNGVRRLNYGVWHNTYNEDEGHDVTFL